MNAPEIALRPWCFKKPRSRSGEGKRWWTVVTFAVAMAWVESAVVYYLRTMIHRIEPYQPDPLPVIGRLGPVELVREAATLVMLLAVGILAGRTWTRRWGYAAIAFGVWDIFYYLFLRVMSGWPHSLLDWDILFLLPLPWWGPVWAPVAIASLMIMWGGLVTQEGAVTTTPNTRTNTAAWALCLLGVALALYTFMADSWRVCGRGVEVVRKVLPAQFDWPRFCLALLLLSAPLLQRASQGILESRNRRPS